MATPVTLRVQQQGYLRAAGYQASQWVVTIPPVVTSPTSYEALFVVDTTGPVEILRRVATLTDFSSIVRSDLVAFDMRASNGDDWFDNVQVGDKLWISPTPDHWLQTQAPYDDGVFEVFTVFIRDHGVSPQILPGKQLVLPAYVFTPEDVGRWVRLAGFTTGGYNGLTQIVSYVGNVATITKDASAPETGGTWEFPAVTIASNLGSGIERRYFPTRETNLPWRLHRGSIMTSALATGTGGASMREFPRNLIRCARFTDLSPTLDGAQALFEYVRASLGALQDAASASSDDFTDLVTITEGP